MDLLKNIKEIVKNDKEHNVKIEIDSLGVKVYLDYDPSNDYEEKTLIPIEYTVAEEFAYIPDNEYREKFNVNDYGIDLYEITLIKEIMECLESHKHEIGELCRGYSWESRKGEDGNE
mgnify:CR=1 FL=1